MLHRPNNGVLRIQSRADDERKTKAGSIAVVQRLEFREFLGRELVQAGARLLAGGFRGEFALLPKPAGQIRVRLNQRELSLMRGPAHGLAQLPVKLGPIAKRPPRPCLLRDPRRVLEKMTQ